MPSSELNDYIRLQKEIKRLQEENRHLIDENHKLLKQTTSTMTSSLSSSKLSSMQGKFKEIKINDDSDTNILLDDDFEEVNSLHSGGSGNGNGKGSIALLKQKIEDYEKEIDVLKIQLNSLKDKHQEEIIIIQNTYKEKLQQTYETHKREIERLNEEKDALVSWKDGWNTLGECK